MIGVRSACAIATARLVSVAAQMHVKALRVQLPREALADCRAWMIGLSSGEGAAAAHTWEGVRIMAQAFESVELCYASDVLRLGSIAGRAL